jgi:hypothetical protein
MPFEPDPVGDVEETDDADRRVDGEARRRDAGVERTQLGASLAKIAGEFKLAKACRIERRTGAGTTNV